MADRKPLKVLPDSASGSGGGDSTGRGEFVAADTIGVVDGGTGLSAVGQSTFDGPQLKHYWCAYVAGEPDLRRHHAGKHRAEHRRG